MTNMKYGPHDEHFAYHNVHWELGQHLTNGSDGLIAIQGTLWRGEGEGVDEVRYITIASNRSAMGTEAIRG